MGKRKVKRKPVKKLKEKLDSQFNCLFCNHEKSVECKIDHPNKVGHLHCKVCDVSYQSPVTFLDEPVDVYSAWIDACEEVNREKREEKRRERERERQRVMEAGQMSGASRESVPAQADDGLDPFGDEDEEDEDY